MTPLEIYEDLKKKIIWLDVKPGVTFNLVELAEQYNVSRNTVTIALTRLEAEEWVVRNGSHFVVSPLTLERMREITEIRLLLEVQAYTWAMHRISKAGLDELTELRTYVARLDDAVSKNEIVELDLKFHRIIYRETHNNQLARLLDRMLNHNLRFWLSSPGTVKRDTFFNELVEAIDAIEAKDEPTVIAACTMHIKTSLDEITGRWMIGDFQARSAI